MNILFYVTFYSYRRNEYEKRLWTSSSEAAFQAEAQEYADESNQRIHRVVRVCETADDVSIEI